MAKSPMSPPAIARAAVRSSFDDDGDDDGGEEEAFDTDDDPFEDWDDLPSISPASSSAAEEGGGIASLRSFTDALRGEVRVWFLSFVSLFLFFQKTSSR